MEVDQLACNTASLVFLKIFNAWYPKIIFRQIFRKIVYGSLFFVFNNYFNKMKNCYLTFWLISDDKFVF